MKINQRRHRTPCRSKARTPKPPTQAHGNEWSDNTNPDITPMSHIQATRNNTHVDEVPDTSSPSKEYPKSEGIQEPINNERTIRDIAPNKTRGLYHCFHGIKIKTKTTRHLTSGTKLKERLPVIPQRKKNNPYQNSSAKKHAATRTWGRRSNGKSSEDSGWEVK